MNNSFELDYITIRGFKSIRSVERFRMYPINILVGANGAGKSNFIGAFSFLNEIVEGRLQNYVRLRGGADQLLCYGVKETSKLEIEVSFRDAVNGYQVNLQATANDTLVPEREMVWYWEKKFASPLRKLIAPTSNGLEAGISSPTADRITDWVKNRLNRWRVYHLHDTSDTSPMRRTAKLNDNSYLRPDAANLPAFLYLLSRTYRKEYELILAQVKNIAPYFDNFDLKPDRINPDTIRLEWKHKDSDKFFTAASLSDGTLRFIALSTLMLQPKHLLPNVVIVDEPELGLHPAAISALAEMIKFRSKSVQVIVSTQSPILLDHFEPQDVIVANRKEGVTTFDRLDTEALQIWLDDFGLGELWEKNEFGGRPA